MKKTYSDRRKSLFFLVLFAVCLSFFNAGCGLDVLDAVLDDPFDTNGANDNTPNKDSGFENCHFAFSTAKLDNSNSFGHGYVYYKIYNKESKKTNEVNSIETMTNDSTRKYNAATTLINTYSYKELQYSAVPGVDSVPLMLDNVSQQVYIRLTNYLGSFVAQISIDDTTIGIPLRTNGKTFDFGRTGDYDEKPAKITGTGTEESMSDVKGFDTTGDGNGNSFYVVLYGVFSMPTESFEKVIYSPVHYLGEVKIDAASDNN